MFLSCLSAQGPGITFVFVCLFVFLIDSSWARSPPSIKVHLSINNFWEHWCWTKERKQTNKQVNNLTNSRRLGHTHHPHGSGSSACCDPTGGGRGPGLCALLPLRAVLLPPGDGGALCPDRGGPLRLHLHLHLPGGADHLRARRWMEPGAVTCPTGFYALAPSSLRRCAFSLRWDASDVYITHGSGPL